jgi:hypothetical protein
LPLPDFSHLCFLFFRVFREETSLIHRFALQVLYTLLRGLRSGGSDGTLQVRHCDCCRDLVTLYHCSHYTTISLVSSYYPALPYLPCIVPLCTHLNALHCTALPSTTAPLSTIQSQELAIAAQKYEEIIVRFVRNSEESSLIE